jgi:hypothetical protein
LSPVETSTDNSALLCWHHHTFVDTNNITMHWNTRGWTFTNHHGNPITHKPPWQRGA